MSSGQAPARSEYPCKGCAHCSDVNCPKYPGQAPARSECANTEAFLSGYNTGCDGTDCPVHGPKHSDHERAVLEAMGRAGQGTREEMTRSLLADVESLWRYMDSVEVLSADKASDIATTGARWLAEKQLRNIGDLVTLAVAVLTLARESALIDEQRRRAVAS